MEELLGSLLVAVVGGAAGSLPVYLQIRKTIRVKMDETIAVRRVDAIAEAQSRLTLLPVGIADVEVCRDQSDMDHDWFLQNSILLPGDLMGKWRSLRAALSHAVNLRSEYKRNAQESQLAWRLIGEVEEDAMRLHDEALAIVKREMGVQSFRLERPWLERETRAQASQATNTTPRPERGSQPPGLQ